MKKKLLLVIHCVLFLATSGQTFQSVDINEVSAGINANGAQFWDFNNSQFTVPNNSGLGTLFAGEFWIGGRDASGTLHLAAQTYRQSNWDFRAGPYNNTGATDPAYNKVWKLSKAEIDQHIALYNDPSYVMPIDLATWPGNGVVSNGESAVLAPFVDLNGNAIYEPSAGDYPCIRGDQAVFAMFTDKTISSHIGNGLNMDIEVHLMLYSFYQTSGHAYLDSVVFAHVDMFNRGGESFSDVYLGQFIDFDIGNYNDDYVGCDVQRNLFFGYNGDDDDDGAFGYGTNPPAQGVRFLKGPEANPNDSIDNDHDGVFDEPGERHGMASFVYYNNDFTVTGNPSTADHHYNYMQSIWKDGSKMVHNGTNGHAPTGGPGFTTSYMFPGDSNPLSSGSYWTEETAANTPSDRRGLGSMGPFDLNSGDHLELDLAYIYARSSSGAVASMNLLADHSDDVQAWFDNQTFACSNTVGVEEFWIEDVRVYPNPATDYVDVVMGRATSVEWSLISIDGRVVSSGVFEAVENRIELQGFASGTYYLKLKGEGLETVEPLVIH